MSLTTRVLLGLILGLGLGVAISGIEAPLLVAAVGWIEPIGTLWVNAIRMTVIPLVVSLLVVGVAGGSDTRSIGAIGAGAIVLFLVLLSIAAGVTVLLAGPAFATLRIDPAVSASLQATAAAGATGVLEGAQQLPGFREWLVGLIPINPIRAAADGAMLPLIVATLAFSVALTRTAEPSRALVVRLAKALADASLVLVHWILVLAPIGVFALALPLATRLGIAAAGALAFYVGTVVALTVGVTVLVLYPAAVVLGRQPIGRFARAALPAQAVAISARSSLAALPPMIEEADRRLGLPRPIVSFFLPLSASVFRIGSAIGLPVGVMFIAALYGVELGTGQLLTIAATSVLLTFSVPGIPGGSILIMAPVLIGAGVPVEGIGILLGVDTIPDMIRTTANVTGHMAAGSILARRTPAGASDPTLAPTASPGEPGTG